MMFALRARALHRLYSTSSVPPPIKLIAELRKQTSASISKAREALVATNNDLSAALEWLKNDLSASSTSSASKLAKVSGRTTNEGLVGLAVLSRGAGAPRATGGTAGGVRAAMVEMNCETDFVARGELFGKLLSEVAHSAAFHAATLQAKAKDGADAGLVQSVDLEQFLEAPLMSYTDVGSAPSGSALPTVSQSLRTLMGKVGENISIRRAAAVRKDLVSRKDVGLRVGSYGHGGTYVAPGFQSGRIATLAILALKAPLDEAKGRKSISDWFRQRKPFGGELAELESALARQIAGFPTTGILPETEGDEGALYSQPFLMYPPAQNESVSAALAKWAEKHELAGKEKDSETGVEVVELLKWTVGGESVAARNS